MKYFTFTATNRTFNITQLEQEIKNTVISSKYHYLNFAYLQTLEVFFYEDLLPDEISVLNNVVNNHQPQQVIEQTNKYDGKGLLMVSSVGLTGKRKNLISHNFCDKTTWWTNSYRVTDEVMINTGNNIEYRLSNDKIIINASYYKIPFERVVRQVHNIYVIVKVNDQVKIEDKIVGDDILMQDYYVNYSTGRVYFNSPLEPSDVVKISYNTLQNTDNNNLYGYRQSTFRLRPPVGKIWTLYKAEVQFSENCQLQDSVLYIPCSTVGKDPSLNPLLNIYPYGTEIPIPLIAPEERQEFNTMWDFIEGSDFAYPIPKNTTNLTSFRNITTDVMVYVWNYQGYESMQLNGDYGQYLDVFLENDTPVLGDRAVMSIYYTENSTNILG